MRKTCEYFFEETAFPQQYSPRNTSMSHWATNSAEGFGPILQIFALFEEFHLKHITFVVFFQFWHCACV